MSNNFSRRKIFILLYNSWDDEENTINPKI